MTENMLAIHIDKLKTRCIIGVYPRERKRSQPLLFAVSMYYSGFSAAHTDRIKDAIDYAAAAAVIRRTATTGKFYTLEALCRSVADTLLSEYPQAAEVMIRVQKPRALPGCACPGVEYRCSR